MMKGKLMKSLFRGKGVPRTPGPQGCEDSSDIEPDRLTRLRVHSEEHNSTNSLDSPCSESPKSWPSTFTTPMNYIKGKKRKHSRFHIPSPLEQSDDVFGGVEEHNLSHQSINSDAVSFLSFNDSATGGDDVEDGAACSKRQQQDNGGSSNGSTAGVGISKSAAKIHSEQQEMYIQQLLQQLDVQQKLISDYEIEKKRYEERIQGLTSDLGDRTSEARALRDEMHVKKRLEITVQDLRERLQHLESENRNLQQRVNDASPLTDHQKELLLHNRMKSCSAPPSIMAGSIDGQAGAGLADSGEELSCEWEVKSSGGSSVHSEVSVACLQDKLVQMEENNYSTHEELQATLQELTDLQHQLEELQSENRTLSDEKSLLYESLCEQTDKLEACRSQLESTRQLLLQKEEQDKEHNPDRERKLLDVLKSAQDERDRLESKANDLSNTVDELRSAADATSRETALMQERMAFLERTLHTVRMEKEHKERELNDLKNDLSVKMMELSRLQTLNENFKAKLEELEAARDAVDKTEIEAKLDELRREKDGLEVLLNEKSQQVDKLEFEQNKMRDAANNQKQELEFAIKGKSDEIDVLKGAAAKLSEEKNSLFKDMEELQSSVAELEVKCQHHLSDKRELRANLSEIQKTNSDLQSRLSELESQLSTEKTRRVSDADEWKQFQADLLISVRVANDFQNEAQSHLEEVTNAADQLRERVRTLEMENDRLKMSAIAKSQTTRTNTTTSSPSQSADLTNLRAKYLSRNQDNKATVKGLIDSIESAAKAKTASYSRSSSTPAMPTLSPISEHPNKPVFTPSTPTQIKENPVASTSASPLKSDAETSASPVSILSNKAAVNRHLRMFDSSALITGGSDPLAALVKNGGSKRNALLKWCQSKTAGYVDVDITNFSSSWNDGMAFCALLHTYIPDKVPYSTLKQTEKRRNFTIAFTAAESVGIPTSLNLTEMVSIERPDWQQIMTYVTNIYKYFET